MDAFIEDTVDYPDQNLTGSASATKFDDGESDYEENHAMPIYVQCIGCIKSDVVHSTEGLLQCYQCGTRSHIGCIKIQFGMDERHCEDGYRWLCPQCDPAIDLWDDQ